MHVVWQTWHEPFGATVALNEDPDGDDTNVVLNLRFSNQYYDAETGFHYNWHRYYDPVAGRYLAPDRIVFKGTRATSSISRTVAGPYLYSLNSPSSVTDPTGLGWQKLAGQVGNFCFSIVANTDKWWLQLSFEPIASPFALSIAWLMDPAQSEAENPEPGWDVSLNISTDPTKLFELFGLSAAKKLPIVAAEFTPSTETKPWILALGLKWGGGGEWSPLLEYTYEYEW